MNQALSTLADARGRSGAAGVTGAYKVDISRGQARSWRYAFFGMLALSGGLAGGLVFQSLRGTVTP
jgi:type IV secretion system protein VirB5